LRIFPPHQNFDATSWSLNGAAGFSGFARPKTVLPPETERSLTSEFGTGSGGSHALWPATRNITSILGAYKPDGKFFSLGFKQSRARVEYEYET
jgi:hypothetical protein